MAEQEPVWRLRFKAYRPLELVDFVKRGMDDDISRWALEELDRQLVAMGCEPKRG